MHGSSTITPNRELAAWNQPLTADGDERFQWATNFDDKIWLIRISANEYRIIAVNAWGRIIEDNGAKFETVANTEADARARADFMIDVLRSGQNLHDALIAYQQANQPAEQPVPVLRAAAGTRVCRAGRHTTSSAQQRAITTADPDGIIHRGPASIRTLQALIADGHATPVTGNWYGRTTIVGAQLTSKAA